MPSHQRREVEVNVVLDTNGYSAMANGSREIAKLLESADGILVPAVVVGELMYGFLKGSRCADNEAGLNQFLEQPGVSFQPVTRGIAERYGYVRAALRTRGTPIPENDIWIAATALETGCRLLSYDGHFDKVGGLVRIAP